MGHGRDCGISIHAPREGCDDMTEQERIAMERISIHAPREGCDLSVMNIPAVGGVFQSTHPVRGATRIIFVSGNVLRISIHAPREGCDC